MLHTIPSYELEWSADPGFASGVEFRASATDPAFVDLDDPSDLDPFAAGDYVSFTAPTLADGTWWWRVRAFDPSDGVRGPWLTSSFTISSGLIDHAWRSSTSDQLARGSFFDTVVGPAKVVLNPAKPGQIATRSPTAETGGWLGLAGVELPGGGMATALLAGTQMTIFGFPPLHENSIVEGITVKIDASKALIGTALLDVELSWNGGASWTAVRQTPPLTTSQMTYTLGGPADLWGHAWTETEVNALRMRITARQSGISVPEWQVDWARIEVTFTNHAPSGTYRTEVIRDHDLHLASGSHWKQLSWKKFLPSGCTPPLCDVRMTLLDAATGTPIGGFIDRTTSPVDLSSLDPAAIPEIRVEATLVAASPSPELLEIEVSTLVGPTAIAIDDLRARWQSRNDVEVSWIAVPGPPSRVLRAASAGGPFEEIGLLPVPPGGLRTIVLDRPPHADAWYVVESGSARLGPVRAERDPAGCRAAPSGGLFGLLPLLLLAIRFRR